jgi:hypothetical protein
MTVRGGGVPIAPLGFHDGKPGKRMGPPPRSFAADAHECIMVRVLDPPDTRSWRDWIRARKAGSPLTVIPTAPSGAVVLEAVKVWPGKGGVRRKVGATANLDSSYAAPALQYCGSGRRNRTPRLHVEQRNRSRKMPL